MELMTTAMVPRVKIAAAIIGASALALLAAMNGQARAAGGRAGAPASQHRPASPNANAEADADAGLIDLISPRIGVANVEFNGIGGASLMLTTNFGRTFTSIGPKPGRDTVPDAIYFLDRLHGWFATFNVATLAETLYRTTNGGRTWRASLVPGHNDAGGARDSLQFLTPRLGYLTAVEPTAPREGLYRTTDGGATWRLLAATQLGGHGSGVLPGLGDVVFQPGGKVGWLADTFGSGLERTADGGRAWHPASIRAPHGALLGLPSIFGRTVTEPVTIERGDLGGVDRSASLRLYVSANDGKTWVLGSTLARAASPACTGPLLTSLPAGAAPWLAAFRDHHLVVSRPSGPRSAWIGHVTSAPVPSGVCGPAQIAGAGTATAWLATAGRSGAELIYVTRDGGRTWHRIDQAVLAALHTRRGA
ncbi:MAG: WD40/YVTN/BNR-like repeat-containing protein [Streptosporangiaceae bacterium]